MAKCAACDSTVLFGGQRDGELRYCNEDCQQAGPVQRLASEVPQHLVLDEARKVRAGECPSCGKAGSALEVFTSHRATSYLIMTSWRSYPVISCRACHLRAVGKNSLITLLFGWWGFPWGLLATPIQLLRNGAALFQTGDTPQPSDAMLAHVRMHMGQQLAAGQNETEAPATGVAAE